MCPLTYYSYSLIWGRIPTLIEGHRLCGFALWPEFVSAVLFEGSLPRTVMDSPQNHRCYIFLICGMILFCQSHYHSSKWSPSYQRTFDSWTQCCLGISCSLPCESYRFSRTYRIASKENLITSFSLIL